MAEEEQVNQSKILYDLDFTYNADKGLRGCTLDIKRGYPEQFLGFYRLEEWNYGEKLHVEVLTERYRQEKIAKLQAIEEQERSDVDKFMLARLTQGIDTESFVVLQALQVIRESPVALKSMSDFQKLPGRLGTVLCNLAGYINITPVDEKKG